MELNCRVMGYLETHIPNKLFIRRFVDFVKSHHLKQYYSLSQERLKVESKQIVYMADGKMHHGGLADRLCGMVSAYNFCKKNGYKFKINFVSPYDLSDILEPGIYDWRISQEELTYNSKDAHPVYISNIPIYEDSERYFHSKIDKLKEKQIHLYTNARYFHIEEFPELFTELFKPCKKLQELIDQNRKQLPKHYVSLTFRFQQLLGDFKEDGFPTLESQEEKNALINKCLKCIEDLHRETNSTILVTSESQTFLAKANEFDFVYIIPGSIRHMDYNHDENINILVDMKSFVDFYLLADADRLYSCCYKPLYYTGFPLTASYVKNRTFERLF